MFATKALICTLLLKPLMATSLLASQDILQKYITNLSKSYQLDTTHAPFNKVDSGTVHCSGNVGTFADVWEWQTFKNIGNIEVEAKSHVDAAYANRESETNTFKSIKSVAVAHGTTKGWTIGSKAIGKVSFPDVGEVSVEISAQYKDESTDTTTETTTTEYDAQCPGQTYCTIETVTFSYKITGTCWRETWYDFMQQNQPAKLCSTGPFDTCYNMAVLYYNGCSNGYDSPDTVPCQVTVQIRDDAGDLLKLVVASESKL
ncbi:Clostridium epsilon toxin MTX2 [Akanthomyces lecanii RCEF 1005]|uniref:Clostridium epsilon toxin MTX2 n=1 Tax=Akanthomyces lecanii RCEF 1005 TaxID=1081108 RepID=A0A162JK01_CORDF|nr:Clostridium epsilon toxin MTX2 [Akanthomyces lecanii RCEF 1005]